MQVREFELDVAVDSSSARSLSWLEKRVMAQIGASSVPIRFVVNAMGAASWRCDVAVVEGVAPGFAARSRSLFEFRKREAENTGAFNVALVIPTGIACTIGGHAGDANPVVKLMASVCDTLITHPNAVNASDLNELPANALYVEGSTLSRLLMGTAGLRPTRANRVLAAVEAHEEAPVLNAAINSVAAAVATYGLSSAGIVLIDPALQLASHATPAGRASGAVRHLDRLFDAVRAKRGQFDALAISTRVQVDAPCRTAYYRSHGELVNPWGGVEALLTHAVSTLLGIPTAHAPMYESVAVAHEDIGVVDARMAAEAISTGFFMCVLKGLQQSPRIVTDEASMRAPGVLTAMDVSCLVIPDGCIGLPTLAALEQGIPVIAVRGNISMMHNRLADLPWAQGRFYEVDNYLEAVGLIAAFKRGIAPDSLLRPLPALHVEVAAQAPEHAARPGAALPEPDYLPDL